MHACGTFETQLNSHRKAWQAEGQPGGGVLLTLQPHTCTARYVGYLVYNVRLEILISTLETVWFDEMAMNTRLFTLTPLGCETNC